MHLRILIFVPLIGLTTLYPFHAIAEDLTAKQVIDLALSRSRETRASRFDFESKDKTAEQAGVWDNPEVEVGSEHTTEPDGRTHSLKLGISQSIALPGKYSLREEVARSDSAIAKVDLEQTELRVGHAVFRQVYAFRAASEKARHGQERIERFQEVGAYLRGRTFASPQQKAEAGIVSAKLLVLQRELLKLQAGKDETWTELNIYLGLDREPKIVAPWFEGGPDYDLSGLKQLQEKMNPDLQRQRLTLEGASKQLRLSRIDAWPAFTLSAAYSNGSGFSPEKSYEFGVSFPFPLFNANGAGVLASDRKQSAEQERLLFAQDRATQEIQTALLKYQYARTAISSLRESEIENLEKVMAQTDSGFRKGQVDLLTFIEADGQHSESLEAVYDSQTEFVESYSRLLLMIGKPATLTEK